MKTTIKLPILLLLAAITVVSGFVMYRLANEALLWCYIPLFFLLAGWGLIVGLFENRFTASSSKWRWFALSSLSGLLLGLGFPTMPFTPLLFVAFVPLLLLEREIYEENEGPNKKEVFKFAYNAFVIWNILSTFWVANTAIAAGIFAILTNAFLMCIPFLAFHQTRKHLNHKMVLWGFVVYWISFEKLHQYWELSWTWLTLGNAFAQYPSWVQWYEYTGVFGGSLWILVANLAALQIWDFYQKESKVPLFDGLKYAALILLPILVSVIWYFSYTANGTSAEVVIVQPNYEPHYEKFRVPKHKQLEQFIDLSSSQVLETTDYLVFPETSFRRIRTNDLLQQNSVIRKLKNFIADYPKLHLVTGVSAYKIFEKDEPHPQRTIREIPTQSGDTLYLEAYNAAIQISNETDSIPLYKKSILVPATEIFPYSNLLFFLKPLIDRLGGTVAGNGIQAERSVFNSSNGAIAPVICYESVYGEYVTKYVQKGANAIFIVTNDGWWDDTAGHRQHLAFARLRAIETRRDIARSANTGISAFINQRGDVLQATAYDEATAIKGNILMNDSRTFYSKWGDIIARIAIFTSILLLLNAFVKSRMKQ